MKKLPLLCCILICVPLASCQTPETSTTISNAIDDTLLEAFSQSQMEAESTLNLNTLDKQASTGMDEYTITSVWCGKELPTTLCFYDGQPINFYAAENLSEDDTISKNIAQNLPIFENQFIPKSIDIVTDRESGGGKTVEYQGEAVEEAVQTFCGTDEPGLIRFKFLVPGQEESRVLVEYTLKKGPDTSDKTEVAYAIVKHLEGGQGEQPPLSNTAKSGIPARGAGLSGDSSILIGFP